MNECKCVNWARAEIDFKYLTNHHPHCEHYEDSLIDVWKVHSDAGWCAFLTEADALDFADGFEDEDEDDNNAIEKIKMHREVFDNLREFES